MTEALGMLYVHGVEVPWESIHTGRSRTSMVLPTYPWQRQRCWLEPPTNGKPKFEYGELVPYGNGNGAAKYFATAALNWPPSEVM